MSVNMAGLERAVRDMALRRAGDVADEFVKLVQSMAPRRTGELAESVEVDDLFVTANGAKAHVIVSASYARFVNEGTGIYGPEGTPIRPRSPGGVLVFDWPAAGGIVFAREVSGSEPTHFWNRALERWPDVVAAL